MNDLEVTRSSHPTSSVGSAGWWPFGCLAVGIALIAIAVIPAAIGRPGNLYASVTLVLVGLVAVAVACGAAVYGLGRRIAPWWAAAILGIAGTIPVLLAMFTPGGSDFGPQAFYVFAVSVVNWILERRSPAAIAFLLLVAAAIIAPRAASMVW